MQSRILLRSAVAAVALIGGALPDRAAGPGGTPTAASLLPARARTGDDGNFWDELQRAEAGYSWHKIAIQPSLTYRAYYTDNLFNYQNRASQQDFIHNISPQLLLAREFYPGVWEMALSVGYTPTFIVHSFYGENDRTYHLARIHLDGRRDEQSLSVDHTYNRSSELSSEVGFLLPQESQSTLLSYSQPLSGKLSLSASAFQRLMDTAVSAFASTRSMKSWGGDGFVLYDWLPKTTTGIGLGASYEEQGGATGDYQLLYERLMTRWHYLATGKLDVSLDVGVQIGQGLSLGGRDLSPTPILQAGAQYNPRYGTSFSLLAARSTGFSTVQSGRSQTENRLTLGARQRVYQSMTAGITASYGQGASDTALSGVVAPSLSYDNYTVGFQYDWEINTRLRLSGFYQYMRRESDAARETYSNNQVGFIVNVAL